ncbi:glyoxalase I [Obba rivulosa]|uniref:lactoylglutathione lyase n=1 Tax=Obba rivulosa TaxID=1052685 RepID=A0A8E2APP4_9APHY|nr:glyoxalase I [Obba rivulosa]
MPRPPETVGYQFNHTMMRIKDPKRSIQFYTEVLGMDFISEAKFESFTLYFFAYDHSGGALTAREKKNSRFNREGVLELTHNHGTENDPDFQGYASGNTEPGKGFGHIAITVPDVAAACERFERLGVPFKKRLQDGTMKHIAFLLDPDGYWIEVVPPKIKLTADDDD